MPKKLTYTAEGIAINIHGVNITAEQQKKIKNLTDSVNRKRRELIKQEKQMLEEYKEKTGKELAFKESLFVIHKKSRSLQRFTSEEEVEKYIKRLQRQSSREYIDKATELYKENYIKAMKDAYGQAITPDIENLVRKTPNKDFRMMIVTDSLEEISPYYATADLEEKAELVKTAIIRFGEEATKKAMKIKPRGGKKN